MASGIRTDRVGVTSVLSEGCGDLRTTKRLASRTSTAKFPAMSLGVEDTPQQLSSQTLQREKWLGLQGKEGVRCILEDAKMLIVEEDNDQQLLPASSDAKSGTDSHTLKSSLGHAA